MSALPTQAIDPRVFDHMIATSPCGCETRDDGDTWWLCGYHDGMIDGLASAPTYVEADIQWCITHDGISDVDEDDCDFRSSVGCPTCGSIGTSPVDGDGDCPTCDGTGHTPCALVALYRKEEA